MTRLLIAGASGLVGRHALALALGDARVTEVVAPSRRPLTPHARLRNPVVDFAALPAAADWWAVDGAICALGTTLAAAGSPAAFRAVDHDAVLGLAHHLRDHGATGFALTSSMGANARSRFFYPRTKGEPEEAVSRLGFPSLTIVRPSLLGGERLDLRLTERFIGTALRLAAPLLPRSWRISPAAAVAAILLEAALSGPPGRHIIESAQISAQKATPG